MIDHVFDPSIIIAKELQVKPNQVKNAIRLLDDDNSVPFIARYRKEVTENLSDVQLRILAERLSYLRELEDRRQTILASIKEQDKLSPELEQAILSADSKVRLEDLYLPFRPKRRTKATIAREAGLEPLALQLLESLTLVPETHALSFINPEANVNTYEDALLGAQHILIEYFAENAELLKNMRDYLWLNAQIHAEINKNAEANARKKFADYANYKEPLKKIPSHRALALFRGRREQCLSITVIIPDETYGEHAIRSYFNINDSANSWLLETVNLAWKTKIFPKLELELLAHLRGLASDEAIKVFKSNLRDLLLAAPAGEKATMGLDPGIRTGLKIAVVDATGSLLDYTTVFPLAPHNQWQEAIGELAKLAAKHNVSLISIGNGTGSRETDRLVNELIHMYPDLKLTKAIVNEAGASVYSASELASQELSDIDVSIRGAVSIARRLQDPLAELVKIDPKSIGVGQYQHDISQTHLAQSLDGVVEDCVNAVGVELNTASVSLLARVAGLNSAVAESIVTYRDTHGSFKNRQMLKEVPKLGDKTFQQAAGFLRIRQSTNPLDQSAVHPEAYAIVEKILAQENCTLEELMGNKERLSKINAQNFTDDQFGLPTITDILLELEKPGRDPRPDFKTAKFTEGVETINDLAVGMILEGIVSNVTNFGAFVDIGVHQDGLVHISEMTKQFISDPHRIVKANDIIKVKVIDVDKERRRISLSMKLEAENNTETKKPPRQFESKPKNKMGKPQIKKPTPAEKPKIILNTALADQLAKLKQKTS